ncbi:hypothetical protein TNIN_155261 [Trichonephila inaurata madagascariensis]|uniref:Uncharacterized protein n=1 Tax=Trichonephila inaurata madagascariensis TaxID=2747483 RepID=A0A8X7CHA8_9ARAC|nr:hypothetical protein TNIN_155261 [Trichonephila inaurata madagascariensis]
MEFHIVSGLVVKKLPSSSVCLSGPPTEDRSNVSTHEALDDEIWKSKWLYPKENYRNLSAPFIAKPSNAQLASLPAAVSSFIIPPSEKVLLIRPPEPNAGSSTTRASPIPLVPQCGFSPPSRLSFSGKKTSSSRENSSGKTPGD